MPHNTQDIGSYHAGDAMDIGVSVETASGTAKDITNASAEWLLKDSSSDADANALLRKTVSGSGISITDSTNGKLEVSLETGDTSGLLGSKHHRLRLTDSNGDRVTVLHGSFTISE